MSSLLRVFQGCSSSEYCWCHCLPYWDFALCFTGSRDWYRRWGRQHLHNNCWSENLPLPGWAERGDSFSSWFRLLLLFSRGLFAECLECFCNWSCMNECTGTFWMKWYCRLGRDLYLQWMHINLKWLWIWPQLEIKNLKDKNQWEARVMGCCCCWLVLTEGCWSSFSRSVLLLLHEESKDWMWRLLCLSLWSSKCKFNWS